MITWMVTKEDRLKKHSNLDVNEKEKLRKQVKETEVMCNNFDDEKKKDIKKRTTKEKEKRTNKKEDNKRIKQ